MTRITAAAFACALAIIPARVGAQEIQYCEADQTYRQVCPGSIQRTGGLPRGSRVRASRSNARIVAHPAGCPRRLFCGCGVSVRAFGKPIRELYLSRNYLRFPRASPAAGMVAYRSRRGGGHVAYIEEYLGGGMAKLYDPNSGQRLTRIHTRSIAGWIVVDPHGGTSLSARARR